MNVAVETALVVLGLAAIVPAGLRWLRVSQREHYLSGTTTRFALRWWSCSPINGCIGLVAAVGLVCSAWWPAAAAAPIAAVIIGPIGLSVKGRTSQLAWTRRLRTLAATSGFLALIVVGVGIVVDQAILVIAATSLLLPLVIDLAAAVLAPIEERMGAKFVDQAKNRLARVSPRVVGITGSYGKTSAKNHLAGLIAGDLAVVPSPRSFNNRAGLARAVNEHLADGTDVFIAEMGTYGPGEIADLCRWCPPTIAVITAIGPVHLERFGSLEVTLESKAEIAENADVVVLNIDDERLAGLAEKLALAGRRVIRVGSERRDAEVVVRAEDSSWAIDIAGERVGASPVLSGVQPTNVACALGAAIALGIDPATAAGRVAGLVNVENRLGVAQAPSGLMVIDDTFNSNPDGAAAALTLLKELRAPGRLVVVTPGMIELGPRQAEENRRFARRAAEIADVIVVVGRTNSRSLRQGIALAASAERIEAKSRDEAVAWVRSSLGPGDAVLYENDLPDNYP